VKKTNREGQLQQVTATVKANKGSLKHILILNNLPDKTTLAQYSIHNSNWQNFTFTVWFS